MTESTDQFEKIKTSVEQLRDEIKLKAHLGKAEAKEELEELERKWHSFLAEHKPLVDEAGKTAANAGSALALVGEELKAGYERMRKLF